MVFKTTLAFHVAVRYELRPMKTLISLLVLVSAVPAFATGGFSCRGETFSGKKVEVSACMPHGILGVCSDVSVRVNDKDVATFPRGQVKGIMETKLADSSLFAIQVWDEELTKPVVAITYQYKLDKYDNVKAVFASMKVEVSGRKYSFSDVQCDFE